MGAMQAVVLAGGLATRMRPHTLVIPKAMLEVAGRPFVDWQLERLAQCGFREVVMCIAYLGEQIRAYVGNGARHGLCITWCEDGGKLLGTAGAIRGALQHLEPTFLVTYGDSYLPFDYGDPLRSLEAHADCDGVMAIYKNDGKWDASNVVTDGAWVIRYEKGRAGEDPAFDHIDYGATAVRRAVVEALPNGPYGLDALTRDLAARNRLRACVARERFFEIGSPQGLADLDRKLRARAITE
jgi:N-acetyl-alpha-D-muramate 1-phosphate uridylyltransferase